MASEFSIRRAKASAEGELLKRKGVVGVGVGKKIVKGKKSQEMSIRVYVKKKLPKAKVARKDMIPAEIDGYKTDVIERKFVLHDRRAPVADLKLQVDAGTYNPLTGGISIGPCRSVDGSVFVGTLGCVVEDRNTGDRMMLSNFHVMALDNSWSVGDTMAQPALAFDGGSCPADVVGELQRVALGGEVDCAVSSITSPIFFPVSSTTLPVPRATWPIFFPVKSTTLPVPSATLPITLPVGSMTFLSTASTTSPSGSPEMPRALFVPAESLPISRPVPSSTFSVPLTTWPTTLPVPSTT